MAFMNKEPSTFLVGEKGLDLEPFFVPIATFGGQLEIGDQEDRFCVPLRILGSSADIQPAQGLDRRLELNSIEFTVSQKDHCRFPKWMSLERAKSRVSSEVNVLGARIICPYPSFQSHNLSLPFLAYRGKFINLVISLPAKTGFPNEL